MEEQISRVEHDLPSNVETNPMFMFQFVFAAKLYYDFKNLVAMGIGK